MLRTRIITAVILGSVVLWVLLAMDKCWVIALMGLGCGLCSFELTRMLDKKGLDICGKDQSGYKCFSVGVALISTVGFLILSSVDISYSLLLGLTVFTIGVCIGVFGRSDVNLVFLRISNFLMNIFYVVGMWYFIYLVYSVSTNYLLMLFCIIWGSDIGGYFGGRMFGKHLLAPKISPKKTIEGAISSMVTAIVLVLSLKGVLGIEFSWLVSIIVAVVVCFVGIGGDLLESCIKRFSGIKDSGNILPGHGGVLDRVDALLLGAPIFYLFLVIFKVV